MKTLWEIMSWITQKEKFVNISDYIEFVLYYLEFIENELQARIIAKNEHDYCFFQYKRDGEYNITRPVNSSLFLPFASYDELANEFVDMLSNIRSFRDNSDARVHINKFIYTTQQSIGCALDALPSSRTNTSRKINGDLFERLVQLIITQLGIPVESRVLKVAVPNSDEPMSFQHDIEIKIEGDIVAVGSVKTSSKDRIDKMFMEKFMYNKLRNTDVPHFAIFLHDVQRAGKEPNYRVGQTFLTGHFKAYTIALNPMDGVYYCDLRPIMKDDELLNRNIKSLDCLLCDDIWSFINN